MSDSEEFIPMTIKPLHLGIKPTFYLRMNVENRMLVLKRRWDD